MLDVFDHWRRWRLERQSSAHDEDTSWTPYYSHRRFHKEFLEFVRKWYLPEMATAPGAIAAVVQAECAHLSDEYHPIVDALDDPSGGRPEPGKATVPLNFASYRWQQHCRGLYETPIAA